MSPLETYSYLPGPVIRADYQDFTAVSGNITFAQGQEYGFFTIPILDDTVPEQDESVFVRLTTVVLVQAAQLRTGKVHACMFLTCVCVCPCACICVYEYKSKFLHI